MTAQERQAQALHNMDASDDAYCRKQADGTVAVSIGVLSKAQRLLQTQKRSGL